MSLVRGWQCHPTNMQVWRLSISLRHGADAWRFSRTKRAHPNLYPFDQSSIDLLSSLFCSLAISIVMAPLIESLVNSVLARRDVYSTISGAALTRRDLSVNGTQRVTLGIIAVYVVVIAILWNIPYVRYVLWPFKVSRFICIIGTRLTAIVDAGYCLPRIRPRYNCLLHRRKGGVNFPRSTRRRCNSYAWRY